MAYKITGKLIRSHRGGMPKAQLAAMLGVSYRGLIDKLEDGSRRAPPEVEFKLLKFLKINIEDYAQALIEDYRIKVCEELGLLVVPNDVVEAEAEIIEESEEWKQMI